MEEIVKQTLLYDFYGELLTEHQKQIYEDVVFNDLTVSEVARETGTSRQSVHDMIRRCGKILDSYEEKLGLVRKFVETRRKLDEIHALTDAYFEDRNENHIRRIAELSLQLEDMETES